MEESLSGTLAIDLGNTNTVVAFQDQKDINSVLVEIPNITSSPGVIPTAVWFGEPSKTIKIGISALKMRNNSNSDRIGLVISYKGSSAVIDKKKLKSYRKKVKKNLIFSYMF